MAMKPVEWVLAIFYGPSAHRAVYGRLKGTKYTKDYIQLSRVSTFINDLTAVFGLPAAGGVSLTYKWPGGQADGELVAVSADRPHLKWGTRAGAPLPWKMTPAPSAATDQTIPGDPTLDDEALADIELAKIAASGAGQPYLIAVKLKDEPQVLHLRAYVDSLNASFSWASIHHLPASVRALATATTRKDALKARRYNSSGVLPSPDVESVVTTALTKGVLTAVGGASPDLLSRVLDYVQNQGVGIFFDPDRRHSAWSVASQTPSLSALDVKAIGEALRKAMVAGVQDDLLAESAEFDQNEVAELEGRAAAGDYAVDDATSTVKVRGSAQQVFARTVKKNYGHKCALTGIETSQFLVASHIVPWSMDASIRLDPSNGICLSLLVDRAFEGGFIEIGDDLIVRVRPEKTVDDRALAAYLATLDGVRLRLPEKHPPRIEYLARRRDLVAGK